MVERQSSLMRRTIRRALAASGVTAAILYGWWQTIEAARTAPFVPEAAGIRSRHTDPAIAATSF